MIEIADLHRWDVGIGEAKEIQEDLRKRVILRPIRKRIRLLAGADVSYVQGRKALLVAAVTLMEIPGFEIVEEAVSFQEVKFPYVPGYLTFREAPPLISAFEKLAVRPDLVMFDGQGIAHPRHFGLASHMGLLLGIPSLGCAKSRFVGEHGPLSPEAGSWVPLVYDGREVGAVLRTRVNVKPVYVSPGHLTDIPSAIDITLRSILRYRIPEPLRRAHWLTREARSVEQPVGAPVARAGWGGARA